MISAILWASLLLPQPEAFDSRWSPWMGCFRLIGDEMRLPEVPPELAGEEDAEAEAEPMRSPQARVCLTPEGAGARVRTLSDGDAFLEELLVADGKQYPVNEGSCTGWQRSQWSSDGERLYTVSELTCEEGRIRRVSGISMFLGSSWIEIQSVGSDEVGSVQVRRYRPVDEDEAMELSGLSADTLEQAVRARFAIAPRLSTEDVIEAARITDNAAVEAAVMEGRSRFALDAQKLVELDEAGVAPELIDLMVALSYPEKFVVDREQDRGGGGFGYVPGYYGGYGYDPYYASPLAYPYFYAPFGYYYWYAPYHPIYGVRPLPTPGASVGRVIAGRGYTSVDRRPSGGGGGGRYARPRDGSSGGSGGDSVGSSSGSSSGGTASPSGYSRGGSTGRSAKPKKR